MSITPFWKTGLAYLWSAHRDDGHHSDCHSGWMERALKLLPQQLNASTRKLPRLHFHCHWPKQVTWSTPNWKEAGMCNQLVDRIKNYVLANSINVYTLLWGSRQPTLKKRDGPPSPLWLWKEGGSWTFTRGGYSLPFVHTALTPSLIGGIDLYALNKKNSVLILAKSLPEANNNWKAD